MRQTVICIFVKGKRKLKVREVPGWGHGTGSLQGHTGHHNDLGCYTKWNRKPVRDFDQSNRIWYKSDTIHNIPPYW